ncbi:MAG: hypothetical protein WDO24_09880, partial [Pseudomonadota bacterium]
MQADQQVGGGERLDRALAGADGLDANLGPGRHRIDLHVVDVGAQLLRGGERGGDIFRARLQVGQQR